MSQHVLATPGFSPASLVTTVTHAVATEVKRFWQARENRKAIQALADCDPRLLKDIGLIQSDVAAALDQPWDQDPSVHLSRIAARRPR